jgi:hypothetical protein
MPLQSTRQEKAHPNRNQPRHVRRGAKWAKPPSNDAAMIGAGGTADFFYREAKRLGYVARSAFKVSPPALSSPALPLVVWNSCLIGAACVAAAADPNTEAAQDYYSSSRCTRPRLRPRRVAPGDCSISLLFSSSSLYLIIGPHFSCSCLARHHVQVACQNLGPLEKGGVVVGVDFKVSDG